MLATQRPPLGNQPHKDGWFFPNLFLDLPGAFFSSAELKVVVHRCCCIDVVIYVVIVASIGLIRQDTVSPIYFRWSRRYNKARNCVSSLRTVDGRVVGSGFVHALLSLVLY